MQKSLKVYENPLLFHKKIQFNEMQALTALAQLRVCVLYVLDVSEQCGNKIEEPVNLYESIKPLFANNYSWSSSTESMP